MSNSNLMMRDIQEAREAIASAQAKPLNGVHLTRGEFGAICAGFVAFERQVKTLQDDNRQLMEQIEARGREMASPCESCAVRPKDVRALRAGDGLLTTENTKDTEVRK